MGGAELVGKRCDGLQAGEVQVLNDNLRLRFAASDAGPRGFALFPVADGQDDVCALPRQHAGGFASDAAARAGHDGNPPGLIRDVAFTPCHASRSFGFCPRGRRTVDLRGVC